MRMSVYEKAREQADTVERNIEALQADEAWQETLAGIRARFPNGVMHQ